MDLAAWEPYGAAMQAFHRGQHDAIVVVYDDFSCDEVPISYFFRSPDQFAPYEQMALERCRGRVLDVGAGSGCHALALQECGLQVTALEILPSLVEILRERGVRDARLATWMDLEAEPFDTVLLMMNGVGLAETLPGLRRWFRRLRALVKPDGQVLADSTDVRVRMAPQAEQRGVFRRADGRYLGELHFQLEFQGKKAAPFPQLYVDPDTLKRYASREGWTCDIIRAPDEYGHYLACLTP